MRILVVEDEADLAQAVVDHLRAAAHAVDHAATLDEAQAAVRASPYALIRPDREPGPALARLAAWLETGAPG